MDNAQTALIVGLGGVFATALAGITPTIFAQRLEKLRLKETRDERAWQRRQSEVNRQLEMADSALDALVEFLGYADQLSRGHDVIIAHSARSSRMRAVSQLVKYSHIASVKINGAIKEFEEQSRLPLESSTSSVAGRRVLQEILDETSARGTSLTDHEN